MDDKQFNTTKPKMKFSKGFIITIVIILIIPFIWAILTKTGYIKNYFDIQCLNVKWTKEKLVNFSENVEISVDRKEYFINSIVSEFIPIKILNKGGTITYYTTACDVEYNDTLNIYKFKDNQWKNITSRKFCDAIGSTSKIKHNKEVIFYFTTKTEGKYKVGLPFLYNGKNFEKISEPFTVKAIETTLKNSLNRVKSDISDQNF